MAKNLMIMGLCLLVLGGIWWVGERFGYKNLPGNFEFKLGNTRVYMPILSCVIVSVLLTLIMRVLRRF